MAPFGYYEDTLTAPLYWQSTCAASTDDDATTVTTYWAPTYATNDEIRVEVPDEPECKPEEPIADEPEEFPVFVAPEPRQIPARRLTHAEYPRPPPRVAPCLAGPGSSSCRLSAERSHVAIVRSSIA